MGCLEDSGVESQADAGHCDAPTILCGSECTDPSTDSENCGVCGNDCASSDVCSDGVCVGECTGGMSACGQSCRDLASDRAHCGGCDRPCASGFDCVEGACVQPDGSPTTDARIRVVDGEFNVCGRPIFMNGANTPWHRWNDFGGEYDEAWWRDHYAAFHDAGGNSSRVWISCNGTVGIDIAEDGTVLGATPAHWEHLDSFFAVAEEQQTYVMATLMSFDNFEDANASRWQAFIASDEAIDSYVENYVIPFLDRYGQNPYLWSIDLINEPDWVHEREGLQVPFDRLNAYFARAALAIHENSEVLVTVGMASPNYNARCVGCNLQISDAQLRDALDDPNVYLDFYSPHYYDWVGPVWGNSLHQPADASYFPAGKPLLHGEFPARGTVNLDTMVRYTLAEDVEAAFVNGWQGTMPWTSNGVDRNGGFAEVSAATAAFRDAHPEVVFPSCP